MTLEDELTVDLQRNICPDCGFSPLTPGPRGGMSLNVSCSNCGARFNACGAAVPITGRPHVWLEIGRLANHCQHCGLSKKDAATVKAVDCPAHSEVVMRNTFTAQRLREATIPAKATRRAAKDKYHDDAFSPRPCDNCETVYRGPAVYCSLTCAEADA